MTIWKLFSRRQKEARGEVADVFQYEQIPEKLFVQIVHIFNEIKQISEKGYGHMVHNIFREILSFLEKEHAFFIQSKKFHSSRAENYYWDVVFYFQEKLNNNEIEEALDVIELVCRYAINFDCRSQVNELNERFKQHGVGYQFEDGFIIRVDTQYTHAEIIKPAQAY